MWLSRLRILTGKGTSGMHKKRETTCKIVAISKMKHLKNNAGHLLEIWKSFWKVWMLIWYAMGRSISWETGFVSAPMGNDDVIKNTELKQLKKQEKHELYKVIKGTNLMSRNEPILQICSALYYATSMPRPLSNLKYVDLINSNALHDGVHIRNLNGIPLKRTRNGTQLPLETLTLQLLQSDAAGLAVVEKYLWYFSAPWRPSKLFEPRWDYHQRFCRILQ